MWNSRKVLFRFESTVLFISVYYKNTEITKLQKKNVKMMHRNQFLISWHFIWSWTKFLLMEASMIRRYFLLIFISISFMNMSFILARIPQIFQIYGWVFKPTFFYFWKSFFSLYETKVLLLMSDGASLERFDEKNLVFMKWR